MSRVHPGERYRQGVGRFITRCGQIHVHDTLTILRHRQGVTDPELFGRTRGAGHTRGSGVPHVNPLDVSGHSHLRHHSLLPPTRCLKICKCDFQPGHGTSCSAAPGMASAADVAVLSGKQSHKASGTPLIIPYQLLPRLGSEYHARWGGSKVGVPPNNCTIDVFSLVFRPSPGCPRETGRSTQVTAAQGRSSQGTKHREEARLDTD